MIFFKWSWPDPFSNQKINDVKRGKMGLLLLENKSKWLAEYPTWNWPNPDTQNINSSRFFFLKKEKTKLCGKFHMLPPKCSITKHRNRQFSDPLVPSIRHLTGSKVRTATASTFTLKRASLRLWSATNRLSFVKGSARAEMEREADVYANLRNERVEKGTKLPLSFSPK